MKNRGLFLVIVCLIFLICVSPAFAQTSSDDEANAAVKGIIGVDPSKIPNPENISDIKTEYLKKEWGTILKSKPVIGPVIVFFDSLFTKMNPAFKAILGVEYSLSWAFVFAISIWLMLFFLLNPIAGQIARERWVGLAISFTLVCLIGVSGAIKRSVDTLVFVIKNTWIAWLSLLVAIVLIILFSSLGKNIRKLISQWQEKAAREKVEEDRTLLHIDADIAKKQLDGYKDGNNKS